MEACVARKGKKSGLGNDEQGITGRRVPTFANVRRLARAVHRGSSRLPQS